MIAPQREANPDPPWTEREWAVYRDFLNEQIRVLQFLLEDRKSRDPAKRDAARTRYAQERARILREHPRLKLRGTVVVGLP